MVREFVKKYPEYHIVNLDALTYAGNLENLKDIQDKPNYQFIKADITDAALILDIFHQYKPDGVIHLAAESHVDRSITDPTAFVMTNVIGTVNLLNAAKEIWRDNLEENVSTMSPRMRFLEHSVPKGYSQRKPSTIHILLTRLLKLHRTIW